MTRDHFRKRRQRVRVKTGEPPRKSCVERSSLSARQARVTRISQQRVAVHVARSEKRIVGHARHECAQYERRDGLFRIGNVERLEGGKRKAASRDRSATRSRPSKRWQIVELSRVD